MNITGPAATCAGSPVTLDAGVFASYAWSTGATTQTISVSPSSTTNYSVTVTDGNGCTNSDSHTVTVSSAPTATISAPSAVCASSTGNGASVPAGASSYSWTISGGAFTSSATSNAVTFTAGASGNVTLSVTITNGSCTSNGSSTIPIAAPPAVTITGPATACINQPFTLDAGAGYATYQWSNGATTRFINVNQFTPAATYTVNVTTGSGCTGSDSHTVTATPSPDATINAPATVDPLSTNNAASVSSQPGATYNWSISNGTITAGAGTNSILFSANGNGTVDLSVTVTLASCTSNGFTQISIGTPQQADFSVTKNAPATVQAGSSLTWTIVVSNGGPNSASAQLSDGLPSGITVTSIDGGAWNCSQSGDTVNCSGSLNAGGSNTIHITANAPSQSSSITNNVVVSSPINDPNPGNNSAFATTNVLAVVTCPTTVPSLLTPANGAQLTNGTVTFQWTPIANATSYDVYLAPLNGTPVLIGSTGAGTTSFTDDVPPGDLTWSVVANVDGCPPRSSQSATFNYTPPAACEDNRRPLLISPLDGSVATSPVSFDWTDVPGATRYELYTIRGNGAPVLAGTSTTSSLPNVNLGPGKLRQFTRAYFGSQCSPLDSEERELEIVAVPEPCSPLATPVLSAPGEISSGVEFLLQWGAVPGATAYQVQIDNADAGTTSGTVFPLTRTNSGNTPLAVAARIRAVDSRCSPSRLSDYSATTVIYVLPQQQSAIGNVPFSNPIARPLHHRARRRIRRTVVHRHAVRGLVQRARLGRVRRG